MIVKMLKVYVVSRTSDSDRLLKALRDLGVVHLTPVDPAKAVAEEQTLAAIDTLGRAAQILSTVEPAGETRDLAPQEAAGEVLGIHRRSIDARGRLSTLHRQVEQLALWGDATLEQFDQLHEAGLEVRLFSVPTKMVAEMEAELVHPVAAVAGKRTLVAVVDRTGKMTLPEGAEPVEMPKRDRPSLLAEAAEIDAALQADQDRLAALAGLTGALAAELATIREQAIYTVADRGALDDPDLFALQGWAPANLSDALADDLATAGVDAAVQITQPAEDEEPPTLVRYPRWAQPISGLFQILGTVAGYKEFDVSAPFMLALPIFAAMLIGDGGYGAILFLAPLIFRKKAAKALGADFSRLVCVIGAVAMAWGLLSASFFGVVLYKPLIPVDMSDSSRNLIMQISFYMGAIHLSCAQLWRGLAFWPSLKTLSTIGWAVFIWGMLGVVMFFILNGPSPTDMGTPCPYLLAVGAALAILFDSPSKNPGKMLLMGLANFPLSMLSAFSDVISYVRLMAVGLASGVLAASFNELAFSTGSWPAAILILIPGHGLNLGLALIAIFAHGVRLNMLEFSNNLGMQWAGYPYEPFAKSNVQEIQK